MVLVFVGPSGSGKSYISRFCGKEFGLDEIVSYTTRPKRAGDKEGLDYFFVSPVKFQQLLGENYFAEYVTYGGNYYGIAHHSINVKKGYVVVDPKGLKQLEGIYGADKLYVIYIETPLRVRLSRAETPKRKKEILSRVLEDRDIFTHEFKNKADYIFANSQDGSVFNLISHLKATVPCFSDVNASQT